MQSLVGPGDVMLFEARVYIDGVLVAYVLFEDTSDWVNIITVTTFSTSRLHGHVFLLRVLN